MKHYDCIVIGAGAGGLFTAGLLANRGYRTLVVEQKDIYGGRAATRYIDGFAVNTGALGIELGTETEQIFNEVGAVLRLREPSPGIMIKYGQRYLNISTGISGVAVRFATRILGVVLKAIPSLRARPGESTREWVNRFTASPTILGTVHNFVGSIFAAAPDQLPADLFLHYVTTKGAFKRFGFPPGGTGRVWDSLVEAIKRNGGDLLLDTEVKGLNFNAQGNCSGVIIENNGNDEQIHARVVISDIGPDATLKMCEGRRLPSAYVQQVKEAEPAAIITTYFASQKPLLNFSGFICFSKTRRLCYASSFHNCPENSPEGWYIYCGASVPQPCTGNIDVEAETALLMADLRDQFPEFDNCRVLDVVVTMGDWPAQRVIAGRDLPYTTPITNLYNVGDAVKQWGNAATTACAETAQLVAEEICEKFPLSEFRASTLPERYAESLAEQAH